MVLKRNGIFPIVWVPSMESTLGLCNHQTVAHIITTIKDSLASS